MKNYAIPLVFLILGLILIFYGNKTKQGITDIMPGSGVIVGFGGGLIIVGIIFLILKYRNS